MSNLSYLSPKTEKRKYSTHGTGLYATEPILKGHVVAVKGGYIMSRARWVEIEKEVGEAAEIHISDDLVIAPNDPEEFEGCMMALNHSCEPNIGVEGQITYIAMRDIKPGEQLCLDYAMIDDYDGSMECNCKTSSCRKIINGKEWQKPELQKKYRGYFATFIQKKIDSLNQKS